MDQKQHGGRVVVFPRHVRDLTLDLASIRHRIEKCEQIIGEWTKKRDAYQDQMDVLLTMLDSDAESHEVAVIDQATPLCRHGKRHSPDRHQLASLAEARAKRRGCRACGRGAPGPEAA